MLSALEFSIFQKQPLRGVLLEKLFSEISQNSQENICGKVSFSIKLHNERLLLIFLVSSLEDFLLISFQQKNEIKKGKYPDEVQIFTFCSNIDLFDVIYFKRNSTENVIRKCV